MAETRYTLNEKQAREFANLVAWRKSFRVLGAKSFANTETTCTIDVTPVPQKRTTESPSQMLLFALSGWHSCAGTYYGKSIEVGTLNADAPAGTTTAITDIGTLSATQDIVAINLDELGEAGHRLDTSGNFKPYVFIGFILQANADGSKVVAFNGEQFELCNA